MNTVTNKERWINNNLRLPKNVLLLTFFLTILIILIQSISAIQIEMKDKFSQGETLIAKISGNFVDVPTSNNIFFYRGHVRVPMTFNISKIEDDYYLYALLSGKVAGNYSMQIQNVRYYQANKIVDNDTIKNFTVTEDTADFYVIPGFLKTTDDFSLELTNLRDNKIEITITSENASGDAGFFESLFGTGSSTQIVGLSSGQTKKVNFNFDDSLIESEFKTINLESENTSYSVSVYMEVKNKSSSEGTGKLNFEPLVFNISMSTNSNTTRVIYLYNKENISVKNISIYVSEPLEQYINLSVTEMKELDENSSIKIILTISSGEDEDNLEGQITAKYENESVDLFTHSAIFLNFIKDYVPQYLDNTTVINTKTCQELNGTKCNANETCSGESVYAQDGNCCLTQCNFVEEGSTGKIIGWGLVALVVILVIWFLIKRYKKASSPIDLLKIARGKR